MNDSQVSKLCTVLLLLGIAAAMLVSEAPSEVISEPGPMEGAALGLAGLVGLAVSLLLASLFKN